MTIGQLFNEIGLPLHAVNGMLLEMSAHNRDHACSWLTAIDQNADIDQLTMAHLPFIGRALAKVQGEIYLDGKQYYSLELDENAMQYAIRQLDPYFRRGAERT